MNNLRLVLHGMLRDLRAGEMRILAAAVVVAVAAVSAVGFFTDRVERGMEHQAADLLAADLLVRSTQPINPAYTKAAQDRGLATTRLTSFPSVLLTPDDDTQLIALKAVEAGYPLRGQARIADQPYGLETPTQEIPQAGTVWLDPRLFAPLQLDVGAQVLIGSRHFLVAKVFAHEPDRGGDLFQLAPRVLMNAQDIDSTSLITDASRVRYRLLVAGDEGSVAAYREWLEPLLEGGERLQDVRDARPEMRTALERGSSFLGLAAIITVIIAGAAVAVAAQRFAEKQADASAIMRCLGASQKQVLAIVFGRLGLLALLAGFVGSLIGYLAQTGLSAALVGMFNLSLPAASMWPWVAGLFTGFVTLIGFGLPAVLRIQNVPVLRVLRHDLNAPPPAVWLVLALALAAIGGLILWQASDLKLAIIVLAGTSATILLLVGAALLLLKFTAKLRQSTYGSWRFGLANIARHAEGSVVQMVAFGIGIMALLILAVVRVDVIQAWETSLPEDAPNHFLINIQANDLESVRGHIAAADVKEAELYPMVRGRLVKINDQDISPKDFETQRAQRLVQREFNLSWAETARSDNPIVAGNWWTPEQITQRLGSIEKGIAEELGVSLGDRLTYRVAGQEFEFEVSNFREVEWDSFRVNFFVVTTPIVLQEQPTTYITSFHLPENKNDLIINLVKNFPSITVFDIDALMTQIRGVMERAIVAVEYVFMFTLIAGLIVLYAAVTASGEQRKRENALLRTLGASKNQIRIGLAAEFITLGCLAGLLAATTAAAVGLSLSEIVFELDYQLNPWVWIFGILGGGLGIGLAGIVATNGILNHPPLAALREV